MIDLRKVCPAIGKPCINNDCLSYKISKNNYTIKVYDEIKEGQRIHHWRGQYDKYRIVARHNVEEIKYYCKYLDEYLGMRILLFSVGHKPPEWVDYPSVYSVGHNAYHLMSVDQFQKWKDANKDELIVHGRYEISTV